MNGDHVTASYRTGSRLLIEEWLPIRELGIEGSEREAWPRPPLNQFHVWWARRPLAPCNGVQLAALLPSYRDGLETDVPELRSALDSMRERRPDLFSDGEPSRETSYREWVVWLSGVWGDVKGTWKQLQIANSKNEATQSYSWKPAYNNSPTYQDLATLHAVLSRQWGTIPSVLDPTAGGGAIPFTAQRYGLPAFANDLNPVAVGILEVCLDAASNFGTDIVDDARRLGETLCGRIGARLAPFFAREDPDEHVTAYIHAHTVACPRTGGPVPLSPSWWLNKAGDKFAAKLVPVWDDEGAPSHIDFRVVSGDAIDFDPNEGTVSRGVATSPWDGLTIDGDYIKAEAQAGRMWSSLYAVAVWKPRKSGRGKIARIREATEIDALALEKAAKELADLEAGRWMANDILPHEAIPAGLKTSEPHRYGIAHWREMFTPRQQLTHGVFVEEWRRLRDEVLSTTADEPRSRATLALLAMMQNKALNYNARLCVWHISRGTIANLFSKHDFAFAWSHGEFEGSEALYPWCLSQVLDAYKKLAGLLQPSDQVDSAALNLLTQQAATDGKVATPGQVTLTSGSATDLSHLRDQAVECVNIDPPYYDNVMYAELADFFYVWEKRTLGTLQPDRFSQELTDKDNEAVANPARFDFAKGKQRKQLADSDYESKMRDIFAESRRVLRDDGILIVWFTHKRADAWDTLGAALMDAGFTIETSWPINTESGISLHQANVNAAKSTIVLVCRKRLVNDTSRVFFEDVEAGMRSAARKAAEDFEPIVGHGGVDLMLSTYGPTLSVLSRRWPVYRSGADKSGNLVPIRPEEALDIARAEVARLRIARLVGHERRFDPTTDFVVLSWSLFADVGFPYDEARKLALGVGADVNGLIDDKVLAKKGSNVSLVDPRDRVQRRLKPEGPFANLYDAASVMLRLYSTDGAGAVRSWLVEHGYEHSTEFKEAVLALANAVPRVQDQDGAWTVELAEVIDEVARNVPTLGLRLAKAKRQAVVESWEDTPLAFGLET